MADMNTNDKKTLLMSKLSFHYLGEIHSMFELSNREVSGNAGSLCGMAAVYQAAVDTILTVFEIKTLTFDEVRNQFIETMERAGERISSDEELLENYHSCKNICCFHKILYTNF